MTKSRMIKQIVALFVLALGVTAVQAGEDCYNSAQKWRMTGNEPENLRVTDADIETLRQNIAAHEATLEAERKSAEAAAKATAAAAPSKEGG
ncbi:MAG: hypothetical protein R3286_12600 [Gammaproteobacteria bacterium]|nr:hypothetical protein [Gammaproteobacteria bacterium]